MGGLMGTELVFTATYCEEENIEAWVRGVHTHRPDADILVVDDSSPDETGAILQRLQGEIPRLQVHTRPGKLGLSCDPTPNASASVRVRNSRGNESHLIVSPSRPMYLLILLPLLTLHRLPWDAGYRRTTWPFLAKRWIG